MVKLRQDELIVADSSAHGFETVNEIKRLKLASSSEDTKLISLAEDNLNRRNRSFQRQAGRGRPNEYTDTRPQPVQSSVTDPLVSAFTKFLQSGGPSPASGMSFKQQQTFEQRKPPICYNCRRIGHKSPECPMPKLDSLINFPTQQFAQPIAQPFPIRASILPANPGQGTSSL